jgi:5-methylthioribose kinase
VSRLLDAGRLPGYLRSRGLVDGSAAVQVSELTGGVSNVVLAYEWAGGSGVVKQALPRLRVSAEWTADVRRTAAEAAALRLCGRLTPDAVPAVLDFNDEELILVIARAPAGYATWKELLMSGDASTDVAGALGDVLAAWHRGTDDASLPAELTGDRSLHELRVRPYHRTVATVHPDLAAVIDAHLAEMAQRRRCLVHGDFSPKNVLVGAGGLWVIDHEVAHRGDPAFDIGFLIHHLVLKALYRPALAAPLADCVRRFMVQYGRAVPARVCPDAAHLSRHIGCLVLARVDGASPVDYLDPAAREAARRLGRRLLLRPADRVEELFP